MKARGKREARRPLKRIL